VPLALFGDLARLPGVRLFSLQWGEEREELASRPELPIADLGGAVETVEETAATLMHLDLIVCPDTMLAHLAGALGRPVWVLLLNQADWRWMAAGERSPWYPTMRLFRQPRPGDWASVVARITEEIGRKRHNRNAE
jgi:ADP-heptose:LPS heptosyltransferase